MKHPTICSLVGIAYFAANGNEHLVSLLGRGGGS